MEKIIEGNASLRIDVPASLKLQFEEACWKAKKSMSEVIRDLMSSYIENN